MTKPTTDTASKRFTLIEMLVVIAIICTLAAMLSPALRRALALAYGSSCANNLKQSYISLSMYADANNDFYPSPGPQHTITDEECRFGLANVNFNWAQAVLYANGNYPLTWSQEDQAVRKSRETYAALACPAAPFFTGEGWENYAWNQVFGMNVLLMKYHGSSAYYGTVKPRNTPIVRSRAGRTRSDGNKKWIKPNNPSRTAFLADSSTQYGVPAYTQQYFGLGDGVFSDIFLRHHEKANICTLDGSVRGCPMINLCPEYNIISYTDTDGNHEFGKAQ